MLVYNRNPTADGNAAFVTIAVCFSHILALSPCCVKTVQAEGGLSCLSLLMLLLHIPHGCWLLLCVVWLDNRGLQVGSAVEEEEAFTHMGSGSQWHRVKTTIPSALRKSLVCCRCTRKGL